MSRDATTDLSFVPTEDLFEELGRRAHDYVFVGTLKCDDVADGARGTTLEFRGGYHAAMGLLVDGKRLLADQVRARRPEEEHE